MKQFELQTPISQLFNVLKILFLHVNFFQIGCSEQSNETHNFRQIIFVTLYLLYSEVSCPQGVGLRCGFMMGEGEGRNETQILH